MKLNRRPGASLRAAALLAAGLLVLRLLATPECAEAATPAQAGHQRAMAARWRRASRAREARKLLPARRAQLLADEGPVNEQEANALAVAEAKAAAIKARRLLGRKPSWPSFFDVSARSGLPSIQALKFGGPVIADLDQDGFYDLVLPQHNDRDATRVYWSNRNGTFREGPRVKPGWTDVHGITAGQLRLYGKHSLDLLVSLGGRNGESPSAPVMYRFRKDKSLREESAETGVDARSMRGRSPRFVDLNQDGQLDVVFVNYERTGSYKGARQMVYRNTGGGRMRVQANTRFETADAEQALVCDLNGDDIPDLLTWPWPRLYRSTGAFKFDDVTEEMLWTIGGPPALSRRLKGIRAVAELDYDNDGRMDLYLAREGGSNDVLLRNMGGYFADVSQAAKLPVHGDHRGVTVGDVNNDGFMDVMVFRYGSARWADLMLINQGDGTFKVTKNHGAVVSGNNGRGDMGQFFVADGDGKLDVLMGNGDHDRVTAKGTWSLFRNATPDRWSGNYLIVQVGKAWRHSAAALGAVVKVRIGDEVVLTRRVGSAGASYSQSHLNIVHFGIGQVKTVRSVEVKWTNGRTAKQTNVKANSRIKMGIF
ncbi:hypothetical protein MMPV_001974 [Pyropia vietnamensis]